MNKKVLSLPSTTYAKWKDSLTEVDRKENTDSMLIKLLNVSGIGMRGWV